MNNTGGDLLLRFLVINSRFSYSFTNKLPRIPSNCDMWGNKTKPRGTIRQNDIFFLSYKFINVNDIQQQIASKPGILITK